MTKLHFKSHVFDFALHPSDHIAAVGLITGDIEWYVPLQRFAETFSRSLYLAAIDLGSTRATDNGVLSPPRSPVVGSNLVKMANVSIGAY